METMKNFCANLSISNLRTAAASAVASSLLCACFTPPIVYQPTEYQSHEPFRHIYEVTVLGKGGVPIDGASVEFSDFAGAVTKGRPPVTCTTGNDGVCSTKFEVLRDQSFTYTEYYRSSIKYKITKDGYYLSTGSLSSSSGRNEQNPAATAKQAAYILRPIDYLADDFLNSASDKELREQALQFISVLRVQSLLNEADIKAGGIGTSFFKGKKYFQFKADGTTTFNTLKLDKYAIGKRIFDDSIRKILNPLNDHISNAKGFYGYDLVFYGKSKSFADKHKYAPDTTEYRFLMPQDAVRRYKNKDISGQQLLDASVLLMDDERIEMRLQ